MKGLKPSIKGLLAFVLSFCLLIQGASADDFVEDSPFIDAFSKIEEPLKMEIPSIDATASVVMDMDSGKILFEKNAFSKRSIASTTKIMTGIVAIENGDLNDRVVISKRAAAIGGSTIHLKAGETLTLRELLYGLMLKSGNDAAIAIAEHIGGSVEDFVGMMNRKARKLGADGTSFKSPHGLDVEEHYSTAYDLALITQYALKNPVFSRIVATRDAVISGRGLQNTNELLTIYPGADGVKTGYTGGAGRCLVASASRNGWRIISVVLGAPTRNKRAEASKKILDYSFHHFQSYVLLKANEQIIRLPVKKGTVTSVPVLAVDKIKIPIKKGEEGLVRREIELPDMLEAPIDRGIEIGSIQFVLNNEVIARSPLKTGDQVSKKEILDYMKDIFRVWSIVLRGEMF